MIDPAHIQRALARIPEIEAWLSEPGAAANPKRFKQLVRDHAALKRLESKAQTVAKIRQDMEENRALLASGDPDKELMEMAKTELEALEVAMPPAEKDLLLALLPPDPNESRNAIMEIRAGTGGDEAALFAGNLFRMYSRFAESRRWKISLIDTSPGELGGFKEIVLMVEGTDAYRYLQYESGGHRVQRVPATESQGRIHTSAATVAVFPEAEPEDDIEIPATDIRIDIFRSSGPGGQSVNTTDSAIRILHHPTGLIVQCQDEKSQQRNREKALKVLKSRLLDIRRQEEAERMGDKRRAMIGSGDRSARIRTYNFPQNRLTDHRINLTLYNLDHVIEGELDDVIEALRSNDLELRLAEEGKKNG